MNKYFNPEVYLLDVVNMTYIYQKSPKHKPRINTASLIGIKRDFREKFKLGLDVVNSIEDLILATFKETVGTPFGITYYSKERVSIDIPISDEEFPKLSVTVHPYNHLPSSFNLKASYEEFLRDLRLESMESLSQNQIDFIVKQSAKDLYLHSDIESDIGKHFLLYDKDLLKVTQHAKAKAKFVLSVIDAGKK